MGGVRRAAAVLEVSPALVCRICKGQRTITPAFALRLERATNGRIRKEALIWGAAA
jgi:DNA-binding transcriptional regulator YdaS (Cro superfamily)